MRNSMYTTSMTLLVNDTSSVPTFPVAMLGLQRADIIGDRIGRLGRDAIEGLQMAALWADDRPSRDAALWADNWPIAN